MKLLCSLLLCGLSATLISGEERCCETAGCFNNDSPLDHLPVPQCPENLAVKYQLFTRNNRDNPESISKDEISSNYDGSRRTVLISHGWQGDANDDPWITKLKNNFLTQGDYNVIVIDWKKGSSNIDYPQSAADTRSVGKETALLIENLVNNGDASFANMYCLGHSLGGHVCGHTGKRATSQIGRITAFDPAGPLFENFDVSGRVDRNDAGFVDVIHSASEGFTTIDLGIDKPIGQVDFYPNLARCQPGCPDCQDSRDGIVAPQIAVCSHFRAIDFFSESLVSECQFTSYPCSSKDEASNGNCNDCGSGCQTLGLGAQDNGNKGSFYLTTNANTPFCKG